MVAISSCFPAGSSNRAVTTDEPSRSPYRLTMLSPDQNLAEMVVKKFGLAVHPRSIERALAKRRKKGR